LKILEEWLKNYQNIDQTESNEEKVIETKANIINMIVEKKVSPYDNPVFCKFIFEEVIEGFMLNVDLVTESTFQG
jgi:hypothetical protein